ncbi:hypothetical protein Bca4012_059826 [Brassica carinata]
MEGENRRENRGRGPKVFKHQKAEVQDYRPHTSMIMSIMNITNPSSFTLVLCTFTLALALVMLSLRSRKPEGQLPPGPRGWPIVGNLFHMIMNRPVHVWIHRSMEDMQTEIACFRFARVHVITVTSSEMAREVLREKDEALADRSESYSSNLISHGYKEVIFSSYGDSWKLMKKMMTTKLMSPTTLNKTLGDRTLEADNIVTYVFNLPREGSINVRDLALTYCHAVMMRMMFGQRHFDVAAEDGGLGPKEKEHMDAIYRALDCFFSFNVTDYLPFLRGWNIDNEEEEVREAVDILNRCNDPIIHERMYSWRNKGGKQTEEDWLDILITLKDDKGMPLFTFDEIRAQCKDINVATIDNTMNNVEWTIAEMLNNPEILEKAANELDVDVVEHCMTCLIYLLAIIGSQILVSRLGLGRNPNIWDEPNVFKPERHLAGHAGNSMDVTLMEPEMRFVIFSTGRRGCAGTKIGTSMTIMLLARLLQGFEWTLPNDTSQVELVPADSNLFMAKPLLACAKPSVLLAAFKRKKQQRRPPSPPGFPIIGNLHQLGELPHQSLWRLSKKYGPVMFLKLGRVPTVVVSSSETAKQALKIHDLHCCSRPSLAGPRELSYNYLDIVFSPYDDYWKELRRMCVKELFSATRVHLIQPIKDEEVKKMIDSVAESASQCSPVNLSGKFLALTVSVICRAAFGLSFHGTILNNDRFDKLVREAFLFLGSFSASDFFPNGGWIIDRLTGLHGRRERSVRDLDAFYEQMIDLHKQEKKQGSEDFVDLLLKLEKEEAVLGNDKLTRNHIKAILMNVLLGAIDTSAITMTWAMAELMRNPLAMKKVQSEIRNHMGNKTMITLDDIDQLHYLKMVIKETWRLHPPAPLLVPREVMSEFEINGYTIQPKTLLYVNAWAVGRDPDTWKDPDMFLPERFRDNNIDVKGQNFELLPFGSGRRICPGMYMGTTMVEFGLANMLFQFDWKLPDDMVVEDMDMEESPGLTVGMKNDLLLVPVKY